MKLCIFRNCHGEHIKSEKEYLCFVLCKNAKSSHFEELQDPAEPPQVRGNKKTPENSVFCPMF